MYKDLRAYLRRLRAEEDVWIALPGEVDSWCRARGQMTHVSEAGRWHIEGPQKERARIAYARVEDDRIVYRLGTESQDRIPVVGQSAPPRNGSFLVLALVIPTPILHSYNSRNEVFVFYEAFGRRQDLDLRRASTC